jgi:hypothetical protein
MMCVPRETRTSERLCIRNRDMIIRDRRKPAIQFETCHNPSRLPTLRAASCQTMTSAAFLRDGKIPVAILNELTRELARTR